jgi:ABC-type transporter Mla subunit MlaD
VEISANVSKTLEDIVERIGKTADFVNEIASSSQEQAHNIEQINTAIVQMDGVTQQNAANAQETASSAQELNYQAVQLQETVGQLTRLVGGTKANFASAKEVSHKHHQPPDVEDGENITSEPAEEESDERVLEHIA